jgi:putative SOS response-associated peptidase YedK
MCGRFIISKSPGDVARRFATTGPLPNSRPRYNVASTDQVAVVRFDPETKERTLDTLRWGLVPFWAKDVKIGAAMINAKAETVAEKPAFCEARTVARRVPDQSDRKIASNDRHRLG